MAGVSARSRQSVELRRTLGTQRVEIMGMLGEGSFATVFSCKISEDKRDVAVKIEREVRAGVDVLGPESFLESFEAVAVMVARALLSPNVLPFVSRSPKDMAPSLPWECFIILQLSERLLCQGQREGDSVTLPPITVSLGRRSFVVGR